MATSAESSKRSRISDAWTKLQFQVEEFLTDGWTLAGKRSISLDLYQSPSNSIKIDSILPIENLQPTELKQRRRVLERMEALDHFIGTDVWPIFEVHFGNYTLILRSFY